MILISFFIVFFLTFNTFSQEGLVITNFPGGKTESEINYSGNLCLG
jgi:hypothetical protein